MNTMIPEILLRSLLAKVGSSVTATVRQFLLSPDARRVAAVGEKTHWIDVNPFTGIELHDGVTIKELLPQVQKSLRLFSETCGLLVTSEPHPELPISSGACRVVIHWREHWRERPSFVRGGGYLKEDPLPACCKALAKRNRVGEWIVLALLDGEELPFTAIAGFDEFIVECPDELREIPRDLVELVVRDWNTFLSLVPEGVQPVCRVDVLEPQVGRPTTLRFQILSPPMVVVPIEPPAVIVPPPPANAPPTPPSKPEIQVSPRPPVKPRPPPSSNGNIVKRLERARNSPKRPVTSGASASKDPAPPLSWYDPRRWFGQGGKNFSEVPKKSKASQ